MGRVPLRWHCAHLSVKRQRCPAQALLLALSAAMCGPWVPALSLCHTMRLEGGEAPLGGEGCPPMRKRGSRKLAPACVCVCVCVRWGERGFPAVRAHMRARSLMSTACITNVRM